MQAETEHVTVKQHRARTRADHRYLESYTQQCEPRRFLSPSQQHHHTSNISWILFDSVWTEPQILGLFLKT